jgi:hypothetical protein
LSYNGWYEDTDAITGIPPRLSALTYLTRLQMEYASPGVEGDEEGGDDRPHSDALSRAVAGMSRLQNLQATEVSGEYHDKFQVRV